VRFRLVVGSDVSAQLETWHRPDAIREMADLVVFDRPAAEGARPPTGWPYELVEVPALEVSSTEIRARVRAGEPIDGMVPPEVATIIATRGLYRAGRV
jgi:nicotinate-nucleotide adenylyltransferase